MQLSSFATFDIVTLSIFEDQYLRNRLSDFDAVKNWSAQNYPGYSPTKNEDYKGKINM